MSTPEQITTAEALAYLGIGRTSLKRYQKDGRIAPTSSQGQTDLWATADLNALRSELEKKKVTAKGNTKPMVAGKTQAVDFEKSLAKVQDLLPDSVIIDNVMGSGEISHKMLERKVQDGFRAYIATILDKTDAVKIIAADLYNPVPKVRHDAFQLLTKYFLPTLQATAVEKIGVEKTDVGNAYLDSALKKIREMEEKQKLLALEGPSDMIILEGEIIE